MTSQLIPPALAVGDALSKQFKKFASVVVVSVPYIYIFMCMFMRNGFEADALFRFINGDPPVPALQEKGDMHDPAAFIQLIEGFKVIIFLECI